MHSSPLQQKWYANSVVSNWRSPGAASPRPREMGNVCRGPPLNGRWRLCRACVLALHLGRLSDKANARKCEKTTAFAGLQIYGAANRGRTGTVLLPKDFKSFVSAYSTIAANLYLRFG